LREQVDAALAAVAARAPDEIESLSTAADRIERAARDLADALRQIAQQRRAPDLP
jgi:ABC-type transporter Mla subunit MlaD